MPAARLVDYFTEFSVFTVNPRDDQVEAAILDATVTDVTEKRAWSVCVHTDQTTISSFIFNDLRDSTVYHQDLAHGVQTQILNSM